MSVEALKLRAEPLGVGGELFDKLFEKLGPFAMQLLLKLLERKLGGAQALSFEDARSFLRTILLTLLEDYGDDLLALLKELLESL